MKQEQEIGGISDWKGNEQSWIIVPYTESMFIRISFIDPEEITFKNASYIASRIHDGAWPSMSKNYGGWTNTCEDFIPAARNRIMNRVKSIEAYCHRKLPKKEKK